MFFHRSISAAPDTRHAVADIVRFDCLNLHHIRFFSDSAESVNNQDNLSSWWRFLPSSPTFQELIWVELVWEHNWLDRPSGLALNRKFYFLPVPFLTPNCALAMCHRLCGLSTYGLKAHVREMSSPLGTASLYFYF